MPDNIFYRTKFWRELRAQRLWHDDGVCVVPGCGRIATHVDHILSRPSQLTTPCQLDILENLRSLCAQHDTQVKERGGKRKSGGVLRVRGCDATGASLDPRHRWRK